MTVKVLESEDKKLIFDTVEKGKPVEGCKRKRWSRKMILAAAFLMEKNLNAVIRI